MKTRFDKILDRVEHELIGSGHELAFEATAAFIEARYILHDCVESVFDSMGTDMPGTEEQLISFVAKAIAEKHLAECQRLHALEEAVAKAPPPVELPN